MHCTNVPKASVVILAYNAVSTLNRIFDEAVMSALTQDYSNSLSRTFSATWLWVGQGS